MKYSYVGEYKSNGETKKIYYSSELDKFYITEFDIENISEDEVDLFELTNIKEIKLLRSVYSWKKEYDKKMIQLEEKVKEEEAKEEEVKEEKERKLNNFKFIGKIAAFIISGAMILNGSKDKIDSLLLYYKTSLINNAKNDENQQEIYNKFMEALSTNKTISKELFNVLKNDFNALKSTKAPFLDYQVNAIVKRIKSFNFNYVNKDNYIDPLEYIIFGKNGPVYKGITYSLDDYANEKSSNEATLFGDLSVNYNYDLLSFTFIDGEKGYVKELANYYNTDEQEIKVLLNLLNSYYECKSEATKESIKEIYYDKLSNVLTNHLKNKDSLTELDKNILGSQIYGGSFILSNNLFDEDISIAYNSVDYGLYKKYYNRIYGCDVSLAVYRKKMVNLVRIKGNSINYNDSDSRFLVYLYLLCYDDLSYHNKDLVSCSTSEGLVDLIIKDLFDDEGFTPIKPEFIYGYLTNGKVNDNDLANITKRIGLIDSFDIDALKLALGVEWANCLEKDCIGEEKAKYQAYLKRDLKFLKSLDEDIYNLVIEALENDESLFTDFKLLPIEEEFKDEKMKEYIIKHE